MRRRRKKMIQKFEHSNMIFSRNGIQLHEKKVAVNHQWLFQRKLRFSLNTCISQQPTNRTYNYHSGMHRMICNASHLNYPDIQILLSGMPRFNYRAISICNFLSHEDAGKSSITAWELLRTEGWIATPFTLTLLGVCWTPSNWMVSWRFSAIPS